MLRLFILLAVTGESLSQIPIPKRQVGFVFNGGHADAPVHLDAYMGPLCPYSRQAFPTITQLAAEYGPDKLKLTIHLFPLPYHRNSFLVAMGQHVVDQVTNGGVSGTPTFMVNDVLVNAYSSWTVTDWKTLIDPLLADHSSTAEPVGTHTTNNLQPGLVG
ncbi:hypothetical protein KUTeg_010362 [Tegillarca granosa]|uniref:Thioredoxin-like fold domain-containing protein n=1 Tax=Tegillarca granosa TaxID=220873 RepID=A0ABQ9F6P3_TEGGR|nr:hypothetical protein KUTeg_010362 [Tegillarca granosa]